MITLHICLRSNSLFQHILDLFMYLGLKLEYHCECECDTNYDNEQFFVYLQRMYCSLVMISMLIKKILKHMEAQVVIVDLGNRCKCAPREHGVS